MKFVSKLRHWVANPKVNPFVPKTVVCLLEGYNRQTLSKDILAGLTVGVLSLPLAMALAISSGVDPQRGLYTACVAGFLISLLGGSRFLVGGPTGAFVVLIYDIVSKSGYDGLQAATLQAGFLLILFGVLRLGALIRFVSFPVIIGFTNGIAITLAISQLNNFFGLNIPHPAPDAIDKLRETASALPTLSYMATGYALATLFLIFFFKKLSTRIPAVMCTLIVIVGVQMYFGFHVSTIESAFGSIPRTLPSPEMPHISFDLFRQTFPDAVSIALLGALESLLCAVIADSMASTKHKSDCELVGQGVANVGSVFFGGVPATAAVARTVANVQLNARTPFAGIFHAITILLLMWLLAPYANSIPLSSLAAILLYVAWNMLEIQEMKTVFAGCRTESIVMLVTMIITILVHISAAVQVGVLLSIIVFMKKTIDSTTAKDMNIATKQALETMKVEAMVADSLDKEEEWQQKLSPKTKVFEIEGPLFFGVSDILSEVLPHLTEVPERLVLRFRSVPFIDQTGIQSLHSFYERCKKKNIELYLSEVRPHVLASIRKTGLIEKLGPHRLISRPDQILTLDQNEALHR